MKCITFNLKHNMHLYWRTYLLVVWYYYHSLHVHVMFISYLFSIILLWYSWKGVLLVIPLRCIKLSHALEIVTLLVLFTVKRYGTHLQKEFKQIPITIYHQASGVIIKLRLFRQMKPKRLALRQNRYWWLMYSTARNILP